MPTISDVARHAGVSAATVSRVLQGAKNVRPSTQEKVQRAIDELGYVPSAVAQSLRSKRSRTLALLVSDITNTFWTTIARGVEDVAHRHDYSVLLCNTDESLAKQHRYLDVVISQQVDGVIIAPIDSNVRHLEKLKVRDIPTVLLDRRLEGWEADSVRGDSLAGARALTRHLINLGHTRIAMISGPAATSTAEDRVAGYSMALAEAGIEVDPRLVRKGEFRSTAGKDLSLELFANGQSPTAIFAANNVIAMGVVDALRKLGLEVPRDIALVSFDDLPNTSRLFPFLTVVAQPVYDLGVNAAQLLLSRLGSEVPLRPRQVVLPVRLVIRHSCGSRLTPNGSGSLSFPITGVEPEESVLVKPLTPQERQAFADHFQTMTGSVAPSPGWHSDIDRPDSGRLLKILQHQEADRVPHIELQMANQRLAEYALERELAHDPAGARMAGQSLGPEDHIDLAVRLGMEAVPCSLSWRPEITDSDELPPPPSLADQLSYLERYLRAAQGTGVGVIANFTSFFDSAFLAAGQLDGPHIFRERQEAIEAVMDTLLDRQARLMRVICDRFASELAMVAISDDLTHNTGAVIPTDLLLGILAGRLERLIAPARDHEKPLLLHTRGTVSDLLGLLVDLGFAAVHPSALELETLLAIKQTWAGRISLSGGIPTSLLLHGTQEQIDRLVRRCCAELAPGGGYVLGSSDGITPDIPPENFLTMTRALRRYGRFGILGHNG